MKTDYIENFLSPGKRFLFGMFLMVLFLLLESLLLRSLMTLCFLILVKLAGKKILWKNYIILIFFITFFNLLSPWGEVLYTLGPLNITKGALNSGLLKGIRKQSVISDLKRSDSNSKNRIERLFLFSCGD